MPQSRVYDPTLARFLSADPFIQDKWFATQAFNRYSYVQNNPLSYSDPTGYYTNAPSGMGSPSDEARRGEQAEDRGKLDRALDRSRGRSGEGVAQRQAALGVTEHVWGTDLRFYGALNTTGDPEAAATAAMLLGGPLLEGPAAARWAAKATKYLKDATSWAAKKFRGIFGKVGGTSDDISKGVASKIDDAVAKYNENDIHHLFGRGGTTPEKLLDKFGSPEEALKELQKAAQGIANENYQTGSWATVRVDGTSVSIKGKVIDGEFRISSIAKEEF
ncbi:RHS repeat-associated core domain-containing protein [Vibrio navarrensis]|uniref:RHS repeat-associated core domain-containing protein n=1 Tax=Vibrio navarrensis TaxID=29495 RepID=UPI0009DDFC21|nr:RHS repeat-associated core domain-containing protein [Vibrio navarrensis]